MSCWAANEKGHGLIMDDPALQATLLIACIFILAYFFAKLEINIEGDVGWAGNLPTWRIENHYLLDLLWGGRPMTGYHAWAFSFILLIFHFPLVFMGQWSLALEARCVASIISFWILEDFMWFVFNPAFGLRKFRPRHAPWHKRWILGAPVEYWLFGLPSGFLFWYSYQG